MNITAHVLRLPLLRLLAARRQRQLADDVRGAPGGSALPGALALLRLGPQALPQARGHVRLGADDVPAGLPPEAALGLHPDVLEADPAQLALGEAADEPGRAHVAFSDDVFEEQVPHDRGGVGLQRRAGAVAAVRALVAEVPHVDVERLPDVRHRDVHVRDVLDGVAAASAARLDVGPVVQVAGPDVPEGHVPHAAGHLAADGHRPAALDGAVLDEDVLARPLEQEAGPVDQAMVHGGVEREARLDRHGVVVHPDREAMGVHVAAGVDVQAVLGRMGSDWIRLDQMRLDNSGSHHFVWRLASREHVRAHGRARVHVYEPVAMRAGSVFIVRFEGVTGFRRKMSRTTIRSLRSKCRFLGEVEEAPPLRMRPKLTEIVVFCLRTAFFCLYP